jgi:hypothetical protein
LGKEYGRKEVTDRGMEEKEKWEHEDVKEREIKWGEE